MEGLTDKGYYGVSLKAAKRGCSPPNAYSGAVLKSVEFKAVFATEIIRVGFSYKGGNGKEGDAVADEAGIRATYT